MDEALITEWYTGRDAKGEESSRLAHRWSTGKLGLLRGQRVYRPHVGDLGAWLKSPGVYTRVRIAVGVDGQDDVRIEQQSGDKPAVLRDGGVTPNGIELGMISDLRTVDADQFGAVTVMRWRPSSGGLDHVTEHGGVRRGDRVKPAVIQSRASKVVTSRVAVVDEETVDLHTKATDLRAYRAHLRDLAEAHADAGLDLDAAVAQQMTDIDEKLTAINDEKNARKAVERAARIAFSSARAVILADDPNSIVEDVDGVETKVGTLSVEAEVIRGV